MTTAENLVQLQRTRLSTIQRNLQIESDSSIPQTSTFVLNKKIEIYGNQYQEFHETHDQLSAELPEKGSIIEKYFSEEICQNFEKIYFNLFGVLHEALIKLTSESGIIIETPIHKPKVKLPILQPPIFNSKYIEWIPFWDQFTALIDKNTDLHPVQKMQYLQASLKGTAINIIKHLPISDHSYEIAKTLLKRRFENPRAIFSNAMNQLITLPRGKKDIITDLQYLSAIGQEIMQTFKNIEVKNIETIIAYLMIDKFSPEIRKEFEKKLSTETALLPSLDDVENQIQISIRTLESLETGKIQNEMPSKENTKTTVKSFAMTQKRAYGEKTKNKDEINKMNCSLCHGQHHIRNCNDFISLPVEEKRTKSEALQLCYNCSSPNHLRTKCLSKVGCKTCGRNHHSLLHIPEFPDNSFGEKSTSIKETNETKAILTSTIEKSIVNNILLATANVQVRASNGNFITLRAMIDLGGEASAISDRGVQLLKLNKTTYHVDITHLDSANSKSNAIVSLSIKSRLNSYQIATSALVMNQLVSRLPSKEVKNFANWRHIEDLELADPYFYKPGQIDLILGAEVYADIVLADIRKGPEGTPTAQKTEFGWILFGKTHCQSLPRLISPTILTFTIEETMEKFISIENFDENESQYTNDEQFCINFLQKTSERDENGRFIIKFPFRTEFDSSATIGRSRQTALRQFFQLERKFKKNADFKAKYSENIHQYRDSGFLTELNDTEDDNLYTSLTGEEAFKCFYLPHHPVIRTSSTSTPVRIVFNASKKTFNGKSLNDIIFPGPTLLNNLIGILLNWRCHQFAFIADIQKMYLQIRVHEKDINYQRIIWRDNDYEPIKDYAINRLSFGLNFAPFAAIQCLHMLADSNMKEFPVASEIIKRNMYMDDLISGSSDIDTALDLQKQLIKIMASAGFNFKKWASNSESILLAVPQTHREIDVPFSLYVDKTIKTLGINWNSITDTLQFSIELSISEVPTKRTVLSAISKIYDPLGILAPVIVKGKLLMKRIWITKTNWDEPVSENLKQEWFKLVDKFKEVSKISIPRWINTSVNNQTTIELHGFCDASLDCYGAVIYLRSFNEQKESSSKIIISKSRVSPIKTITIPRLELCGAVLLTKLMEFVTKSLNVINLENTKKYYWTDSEIVLYWIRDHSKRWKTFVSNRIAKIHETSIFEEWNFVSGKENPADLVSRGIFPNQLNELWFNGPPWLNNSSSQTEISLHEIDETIVEEELIKTKKMFISTINPTEKLLHSCSNVNKLLRYTCWLKRFYHFLVNKNRVDKNPISCDELRKANNNWIYYTQTVSFMEERKLITQNKPLTGKNRFKQLSPFIDGNQILRMGGRLGYADLSFDEKHPIILPPDNYFTQLIIEKSHLETLHGGVQSTLSHNRRKYWILSGRSVAKKIISQCVICTRIKGQVSSQLMGNLPQSRVIQKRPFLHTGMDLCGPILVRKSKRRSGIKVTKGYIVLFICMTTKAVHIEAVMDLSSFSFLMAFQRFVSRRGFCSDLYSDCGTNFIGARKILNKDEQDFIQMLHKDLSDTFTTQGIQFHFNPPSAPSFGGLWEANIKRIKHHLKRVIGDRTLILDELNTLLCRIEAILNSRPLIKMNDQPDDYSFLTPGHFLINDYLLAIPEPSMLNQTEPLTNSYRTMLKKAQTFWYKWQRDYLQSLQVRSKWFLLRDNLQIGDIVLIKDERFPPLKWLMGRIIDTHPGADGLVRVCSVKTENGVVKRPIVKLAPLPVNNEQFSILDNENINLSSSNDSTSSALIMLPLIIKRKFTILLEGNIGVGKSTFLKFLNEKINFKLLPEPVPHWTNMEGHNLLEKLYQNHERWIFPFQSYAILTMLKYHLLPFEEDFKIIERSIFSAHHCFIELALQRGILNPVEKIIFDKWLDFLLSEHQINYDLIIYFKCSPSTCLERIKKRGRPEESNMTIEYLEQLNELYEKWIFNSNLVTVEKIVILNTEPENLIAAYEKIIDIIFQL